MSYRQKVALGLLVNLTLYLILEVKDVIHVYHGKEANYPTQSFYFTPMVASGTSTVAGPVRFTNLGTGEEVIKLGGEN